MTMTKNYSASQNDLAGIFLGFSLFCIFISVLFYHVGFYNGACAIHTGTHKMVQTMQKVFIEEDGNHTNTFYKLVNAQ